MKEQDFYVVLFAIKFLTAPGISIVSYLLKGMDQTFKSQLYNSSEFFTAATT